MASRPKDSQLPLWRANEHQNCRFRVSNLLTAVHYAMNSCSMAKMHDNNHNTTSIATIKYMAPEFILQQSFSDKSDVFSFGMVLWEIFTAKEPFEELNPTQSLYAIASVRTTSLSIVLTLIGSAAGAPSRNTTTYQKLYLFMLESRTCRSTNL